MITMENCVGQCCSHTRHLGVCAHQYGCDHHAEKAERAKTEQAWRDFINGTATNAPTMPQRPARSIMDRRTR